MTKPEMWKAEFEQIWRSSIKRNGSDLLFRKLEETDFFTAPASTKHHLACEGGLCRHSINVYRRLEKFLHDEYGEMCQFTYSSETIAIVALLHDICKINTYKVGWKNQKTYDAEKVANADKWQVKHDAAGDFIWETVPTYEYDEKFIYGHGEKSVYMIRDFMGLSIEEAQAIRFHMSGWQDGDAKWAGSCYEQNPLAFYLHVADEAATFLDERSDAE